MKTKIPTGGALLVVALMAMTAALMVLASAGSVIAGI